MKQHTLEKLQVVAEIERGYWYHTMSRSQRLERWAQLLERNPGRLLNTLRGIEYQPENVRMVMRCNATAISVAFWDPVLRAVGLKDDTYGEAQRFFKLTDWQLHEVLCYCHLGETVSAAAAARTVRAILAGRRPGLFARMFVG